MGLCGNFVSWSPEIGAYLIPWPRVLILMSCTFLGNFDAVGSFPFHIL